MSAQDVKDNKSWFIKKASTKRKRPLSILKRFHEKIPTLSRVLSIRSEHDSSFFDDSFMGFMLTLASKFRHLIVHKHGWVEDKSNFIKRCLLDADVFNNGKPDQKYVDEINFYFGSGRYENMIALVELTDPRNPLRQYDRLDELLETLASYVLFINGYAKQYLLANSTSSKT